LIWEITIYEQRRFVFSMRSKPSAFWSLRISDLYRQLDAKTDGPTEAKAKARLKQYGSSLLREEKETTALSLFGSSLFCVGGLES
jgi:hypothetical protein